MSLPEALPVTGWSSSGAGFESAQLATAGITGDSNLELRIPTLVRDAADLTPGCDLDLIGSPLWRRRRMGLATTAATPASPEDGVPLGEIARL